MSSTSIVLVCELISKHRSPRAKVIFQTVVNYINRFLGSFSSGQFCFCPCLISLFVSVDFSPCLVVFGSDTRDGQCIFLLSHDIASSLSICSSTFVISCFKNQAGLDCVSLVLNTNTIVVVVVRPFFRIACQAVGVHHMAGEAIERGGGIRQDIVHTAEVIGNCTLPGRSTVGSAEGPTSQNSLS